MLRRDPTKYVRDLAKNGYNKSKFCYICNATEHLEFHHYYSIAQLVKKWMQTHPDILETRAEFIEAHKKELYDEAVTLCKTHHSLLHSIYGKDPNLGTINKQKMWVEKKRNAK